MPELGLPLGKKMPQPIALCSGQAPVDAPATPCWVEQPATLDGGILFGNLKVPPSTQGRKWAASGTYGAAIDRNGILVALTVYSAGADAYASITNALSQSFGKPRHASRPGAQHASAELTWKDSIIELNCGADSGCNTRFVFNDRSELTRHNVMNQKMK